MIVAQVAKRVWAEINEGTLFGRAAQLSYYFLLALFPLLLFLISMLGWFAQSAELRTNLLNYLARVMPDSASQLVRTTVDEITAAAGFGKVSLGLLALLWAASNGMGAVSAALNSAFEVRESRPWWKVRLVSIALTTVLAVLILSALSLLLFGARLTEILADWLDWGNGVQLAWTILRWPLVVACVIVGFRLVYYFAPDRPGRPWKWLSWGSVIGTALWILVSLGFRLYLSFFNSYTTTYGSLGGVIILMLWFYLSGVSLLAGGEIEAELEQSEEKSGPRA